jgi:hypothetical protein
MRDCGNHVTAQSVRTIRIAILQCPTENKVTDHIAAHLQREMLNEHFVCRVGETQVCCKCYELAHGVSKSKVKAARKMIQNGSTQSMHGNTGKAYNTVRKAKETCVAFWTTRCDDLALRVNAEMRLQPYQQVIDRVCQHDFLPWLELKCSATLGAAPGTATFHAAAKHHSFLDVKTRKEHQHCRCTTCAGLQGEMKQGWSCEAEKQSLLARMRAHKADVAAWRAKEALILQLACTTPPSTLRTAWMTPAQ